MGIEVEVLEGVEGPGGGMGIPKGLELLDTTGGEEAAGAGGSERFGVGERGGSGEFEGELGESMFFKHLKDEGEGLGIGAGEGDEPGTAVEGEDGILGSGAGDGIEVVEDAGVEGGIGGIIGQGTAPGVEGFGVEALGSGAFSGSTEGAGLEEVEEADADFGAGKIGWSDGPDLGQDGQGADGGEGESEESGEEGAIEHQGAEEREGLEADGEALAKGEIVHGSGMGRAGGELRVGSWELGDERGIAGSGVKGQRKFWAHHTGHCGRGLGWVRCCGVLLDATTAPSADGGGVFAGDWWSGAGLAGRTKACVGPSSSGHRS
jgi:hypothetical protein